MTKQETKTKEIEGTNPDVNPVRAMNFCKGCRYYDSKGSWKLGKRQHGGKCKYPGMLEKFLGIVLVMLGRVKGKVEFFDGDFDCPLTGISPKEQKNIEARKEILEKLSEKEIELNLNEAKIDYIVVKGMKIPIEYVKSIKLVRNKE